MTARSQPTTAPVFPAPVQPPLARSSEWSRQLAPRLFAPPARWGWQIAGQVTPTAPVDVEPPPSRPVWQEPPLPDTSALRRARTTAVSRLVRRLAFGVVVVFAFVTYQLTIEQQVGLLGSSAEQVYQVGILVVAALLAVGVVRAGAGVHRASRDLERFEGPYREFRAQELRRHRQAVEEWERAVRSQEEQAAAVTRAAAGRTEGPLWYPVAPVAEPSRVDVLGGDPNRHGWASLLLTFGSSELAAGHRVTVVDLTGQDVGGGLGTVASAHGLRVRRVAVGGGNGGVDLLAGLPPAQVADCVAAAVSGDSGGSGHTEERALATDALGRVLASLAGGVTFGRLAAGVQVLRQGTSDGRLTDDEVARLVSAHLGDVDQGEWTGRQLRYLASRLDLLAGPTGGTAAGGDPLWTGDTVSLVGTAGPLDDRRALLDRLLVELTKRTLDAGGLDGLLVVAGADHLGAGVVRSLSEHARQARVRLVLMIDQPQGDLERTVGTGGAVCLMKMYNHRDANVAAEFVGRGHRFVVSQVTRQVGKSFGETGSDAFGANTGHGRSVTSGAQRSTGLTDNRGHTWTGTRGWSANDSISTSSTSSRVYELVVDPQQMFDMPETAFILVDSSGPNRRVVLADGNPGICLLDGVSKDPVR